MASVFKFLAENWYLVCVLLMLGAFCVWRIMEFYKLPTDEQMKVIKKFVLALVVEAREKFMSNMGELKFAAVVQWFYERCPVEWQMLIPSNKLEEIIQEMYEYMVNFLSNNPSLPDVKPAEMSKSTSNDSVDYRINPIDLIKIYK